ncbi:HNH endonuclease signature motif containing protein [Phytobacter ursingii]
MKQVTMESVKQRISELTYTGVQSLRGEFELACLRELVAVTEQRDAVVVEMNELKNKLNLDKTKAPIWSEYLEYDKEDGIFIWKKRSEKHFKTKRDMNVWNTKYSGRLAGNVHTSKCGYMSLYITINNKKYSAHRIAWEMVNGVIPDGMSIDHLDHNPLNNSILNLRLATEEEQKKNYPMNINNKSGYVGVSWCKKTNKWRARISRNGKIIELGESKNINEAIELRKAAEKELNFHENHGKGYSFSSQLRESKGATHG